MLAADGACKHLDRFTNACGIYDTRPDVCRINGIYEKAGLVHIVPVELFHDHVIDSTCAPAIAAAGLDPSRVPTRNYSGPRMILAINSYLEGLGSSFDGGFPGANTRVITRPGDWGAFS